MTGLKLTCYTFFAVTFLPCAAHAQPETVPKDPVEAVQAATTVKGFASDCSELLQRYKGNLDAVKQWEAVGKKLSILGHAFTARTVKNQIQEGNTLGATWTVVDAGFCTAIGALCAGYEVGKGTGWLLDNMITKSFGSDRTLNEMWTDTLAGWVYGSGEPSAEQLQQMIARHRLKLQQLQAASKAPPPMCSRVEQAKDELAKLLERAKARSAGQLASTSSSGLNALTEEAVTTAENASASASSDLLAQQQSLAAQMAATANAAGSDAGEISSGKSEQSSTPYDWKEHNCPRLARMYNEEIAKGQASGSYQDARIFWQSHNMNPPEQHCGFPEPPQDRVVSSIRRGAAQ